MHCQAIHPVVADGLSEGGRQHKTLYNHSYSVRLAGFVNSFFGNSVTSIYESDGGSASAMPSTSFGEIHSCSPMICSSTRIDSTQPF